jgi:hypothetical protein
MGFDEFGDYTPDDLLKSNPGLPIGQQAGGAPAVVLSEEGSAATAKGSGGGEAEPGSPEDLGIAGGAPPKVDNFLQTILNSGLPPAVIEEIIKSYQNQRNVGAAPLGVQDVEAERVAEEQMSQGRENIKETAAPMVKPTPNPFMEAAQQIAMFAQNQAGAGLPQTRSAPGAGMPEEEENPYADQEQLMDQLFGRRLKKTRSLDAGTDEPKYNNPFNLHGMA